MIHFLMHASLREFDHFAFEVNQDHRAAFFVPA